MTRWLPITEAAPALGISIITLKRYIRSGKVNATKMPHDKGPRWMVEVSEDACEPSPEASFDRSAEISSEPSPEPSAYVHEAEAPPEHVVSAERLIDQLRHQVTWLEDQIAVKDGMISARDQQLAAMMVLLQKAQQTTQLPPPAEYAPEPSPEPSAGVSPESSPDRSGTPAAKTTERGHHIHPRVARWKFWARA